MTNSFCGFLFLAVSDGCQTKRGISLKMLHVVEFGVLQLSFASFNDDVLEIFYGTPSRSNICTGSQLSFLRLDGLLAFYGSYFN